MQALAESDRLVRLFLALVLALMTLRLISLALYPVMDTSEARYAELARRIAESGHWIVPMYTDQEPFWGKPPLALWLSALGIEAFGVNAFAVRLPQWGCGAATMALMWRLARRDRAPAALALLVFVSSYLGYEATGTVKTDPALMFSVTLAMSGFWLGYVEGRPFWYWFGHVGVGLALLAKGPVGLVLYGIAVLGWLVWERRLAWFLGDGRWTGGLLLATLVALPWYVLAEATSPGFVEYFLIGEHFERFVVPGWEGDRYGSGHARPPGAIWAYLLESTLPWCLLLPGLILRRHRAALLDGVDLDRQRFLVCWLVAPLVLFTFSGNVVATYLMPSLPAASLLIANALWQVRPATQRGLRVWLVLICFCGLLLPGARFARLFGADPFPRSGNQAPIVAAYHVHTRERPGDLFYVGRRRFSAEFYNDGQVTYLPSINPLPAGGGYVVLHDDAYVPRSLPPDCEVLLHRNSHRLLGCFEGADGDGSSIPRQSCAVDDPTPTRATPDIAADTSFLRAGRAGFSVRQAHRLTQVHSIRIAETRSTCALQPKLPGLAHRLR